MSSLEFVPSDYKIRYADSVVQAKLSRGIKNSHDDEGKTLKVMLTKDHIISVFWPESDLTIGWLLSEVTRRFDEVKCQLGDGMDSKLIVALKTIESIPALDYYLTHLENPITPINEKTLLAAYFSNKEVWSDEKIGKNSFHYIKMIGCGGYSNVVLARK